MIGGILTRHQICQTFVCLAPLDASIFGHRRHALPLESTHCEGNFECFLLFVNVLTCLAQGYLDAEIETSRVTTDDLRDAKVTLHSPTKPLHLFHSPRASHISLQSPWLGL